MNRTYKQTEAAKWESDVKASGGKSRQETKTKKYVRRIALKDGIIYGFFHTNTGGQLDTRKVEAYLAAYAQENQL